MLPDDYSYIPESADDFFAALMAAMRLVPDYVRVYGTFDRVFRQCIDQSTERVGACLCGAFAKTDYLLKEHGADAMLAREVNGTRARLRKRGGMTREELGIPESAVTVIGEMDFLYIRVGSLLRPVLGEVDPAAVAAMRPAPEEVADTFLLPLWELQTHPPEVYAYQQSVAIPDFPYADAGVAADYPWRPCRIEVPVYRGLPHPLWGITARITMDVVDKL